MFHDPLAAQATVTQANEAPPSLTSRERDASSWPLCRPLLDRDMFTEPASTQAIADDLVIQGCSPETRETALLAGAYSPASRTAFATSALSVNSPSMPSATNWRISPKRLPVSEGTEPTRSSSGKKVFSARNV